MDCLLECHFRVGLFDWRSKRSPHVTFGCSPFLPGMLSCPPPPSLSPWSCGRGAGQPSCSGPRAPHLSDCPLRTCAASAFRLHSSFSRKVDRGPDYTEVQHISDKPLPVMRCLWMLHVRRQMESSSPPSSAVQVIASWSLSWYHFFP